MTPKSLKTGRFGGSAPAAQLARSTRGAGMKKGPEFIRTLQFGGAGQWGCRVVMTNQIAAGTFLVGSFAAGAQIYDRQQTTLKKSRQDGNNFTKNMVTLVAEECLALTVYRPKAFVSGSF